MTLFRFAVVTGILLIPAWAAYHVSRATERRTEGAREVADRAFENLRQGLETGRWEPFFDLLSDDFTFWFPTGKYLGLHKGKGAAMEFFRYVSSAFPDGIRVVEVLRQTGTGQTFVYEFRDEGMLRGEPYKNRVAISLDVCGDKICGYREYFGSDGKIN
ncbi:MAG: nuclear transport factor 2 family protein [Acidobacteria bacterium]|nr:nuclear transport factor 2 family protein [Acidobacteriota bacterium]